MPIGIDPIAEINKIVGEIKTTKIDDLPYGQSYSTTTDQTKLFEALQRANHSLTKNDYQYLQFDPNKPVGHIPMEGVNYTTVSLQVHVGSVVSQDIPIKYKVNNTWNQVNGTGSKTNLPPNAAVSAPPEKIGATYYLATRNDGLWTSSDGTNWVKNKSLRATSIFYPPVTFANPASKGTTYYVGTEGEGLWTSNDGITWTQVGKTKQDLPTNAYAAAKPVKFNGTYYLGTQKSGLWTKTSDQGTAAWTQNKIPAGLQKAEISDAPVQYDSTIYLATENAGLWTKNGTGPWTQEPLIRPTADVVAPPTKFKDTMYLATARFLYAKTSKIQWGIIGYSEDQFPLETKFTSPPHKINNRYYVTTANEGLWTKTSDVPDAKWSRITTIPSNANLVNPPSDNIGDAHLNTDYVGSYGTGLYTSSDGVTWAKDVTKGLQNAVLNDPPTKIGDTYYLNTLSSGLWTIKDPKQITSIK